MLIQQLPLASAKFATIDANRDVDIKRLIKVIKKDGRVLVPIMVIKYQDIQNEDIVLYDLRTMERLENPSDDYYVVIDGQHRSTCAMQLFEEMQNEESDVKFTDFIYANVLEDEDIQGRDVIAMIMSINNSAQSWKSKDYVKSAYTCNPKDETLIVEDLCTRLNFSNSNTSRFLCNNHKALSSLVLSHYISGESELPESDPRMALEILRMLVNTGFNVDFLRKRYLAEEIVKKHNANRHEGFLNSLSHLDSETVKRIEKLSPQELDNGKIREIVNEFEKTRSEAERAKCFVADTSEERFNENVEFFKNLAEKLKLAKSTKKSRKSNSSATKKGIKVIDECTVDDVK